MWVCELHLNHQRDTRIKVEYKTKRAARAAAKIWLIKGCVLDWKPGIEVYYPPSNIIKIKVYEIP